jgi:hypothetical protein
MVDKCCLVGRQPMRLTNRYSFSKECAARIFKMNASCLSAAVETETKGRKVKLDKMTLPTATSSQYTVAVIDSRLYLGSKLWLGHCKTCSTLEGSDKTRKYFGFFLWTVCSIPHMCEVFRLCL